MKDSLRKPFRYFLSNSQRQIIGAAIFIIGALIGFGFNSLAGIANLNATGFWGDFQDALEFNREQSTQVDLVNMRCPILLAPTEEGTITATFRNPHPEKANILVKAAVSERDFEHYQVMRGSLPVEPGDEQDFRWQVTPQNIIENNFILTRVFLMNQYNSPFPARTDSCGTFVLNLFGLKGAAMVALMLVTSLISLGAGSALLFLSDSPIQKSSPRIDYGLYALAGILVTGMIANLLGWWIFAGLVQLLAVLLSIILIVNMLMLSGSRGK
jgi:hypothetical protein